MVAFPEKRRKERREGHHAGQNPRKGPKGSKEQIKAGLRSSWSGSCGEAGPAPCGTSHQG